MSEDDVPPSAASSRRPHSALHLGPRKRQCITDPLVHHGRHFGRTVHALCNVSALINNGLLRMGVLADEPDENFDSDQRHEYMVFQTLLQMVPGLERRLMEDSDEAVAAVAELIQKGVSGARSDDTKSLKGPVLDWIAPRGQPLNPPLSRNVKLDRGYNHDVTGNLLCPAGLDWTDPETREKLRSGELEVPGDQWPVFLYSGNVYDVEDPWKGLLRSSLLVSAYKHVFTSPSSVEKENKATRSGNARIHGMTSVTLGSIAYIATQVRFALSSSAVFLRTDAAMDSQTFYTSVLELLNEVDEKEEVDALVAWWNRQIFPGHSSSRRQLTKNSALSKIKEKRALKKARMSINNVTPDS